MWGKFAINCGLLIDPLIRNRHFLPFIEIGFEEQDVMIRS